MKTSSLSLPVLPPYDQHRSVDAVALQAELATSLRGQVHFGRHDRLLYSTDASPYEVEPIGVVVPADTNDVATTLAICARHGAPVLPRGGGTSLAGQCTNHAVVVDLSAICRRVLSIDPISRTCVVEAGNTIDELNRQLAANAPGLFYAPDPATVAQASIGGCIGNNASGARSIKYGRTSENIAAIDLLLSTGERAWLAPGAGRSSDVALRLASGVVSVVRGIESHIRQRFPKTLRRNAGYGLDLILTQVDGGTPVEDIDLSGLICGSEGTLGLVLAAKLKLHPIKPAIALAIVSFRTLEDAMDAIARILTTGPTAVELLDDVVLRAADRNAGCRPYLNLLPPVEGHSPSAVLYVEYQNDTAADIERDFANLAALLPHASIRTYHDRPSMTDAWTLRKSGEALLHGLPGKRKPQTFVEDNAIPVEQLPRFVSEFKKIVAHHGTQAAYWAHASVGVLHVRPMLDLHNNADLEHMRQIAVEVADLARDCGGVVSGEHGDGRVRGPLLERYFGPEIVAVFAQIKRIFDPLGILNPTMIVHPGSIDSITENLRTQSVHDHAPAQAAPIDSFFDYTDQDDFSHAVDRCNGAGFCRKTAGGTMCPSYRATLDERHSTRGRGNALRQAIQGRLGNGAPVWNDPETLATLDLCLSCKACKSECPSSVDVARLKAEYLAHSWAQRSGAPLKERALGHIRLLNQLGSIAPTTANLFGRTRPVRAMVNRLLGIAPQRALPEFASSLYRWFNRRPQLAKTSGLRPFVILYADCFTTYNEPHIGQAAIQLLESLGYEVRLPKIFCCGRALISGGLLPDAIATADRACRVLSDPSNDAALAVLVCEPSCLSAIADDWLQLRLATPIDLRKKIAAKAMLVEDFVERYWDRHPTRPSIRADSPNAILHGHCHQKALWTDQTSSRLLNRLTGSKLTVLASGCCGMAGGFGYAAHKYELSMKIGELSVFGPIRQADPDTIVCAPGTSCRHQIRDGTCRNAVHPIELAWRLLCESEQQP